MQDPIHAKLTPVRKAIRRRRVLRAAGRGLLTGAICCTEGFGGARNLADVPRSGARAVYRALGALFFVSVVFSALTYI